MSNKDLFCIDLDDKRLEVKLYDKDDVALDIEHYQVKSWKELPGYDRKIFNSEKQAEKYLSTYQDTLSKLDNNLICIDRKLPAMLYKRRYIVQTLLGEKLQTFRHYKKNWKAGQLFNLHDQTYFLTVKLVSIEEVENGKYCYKFKLIKR